MKKKRVFSFVAMFLVAFLIVGMLPSFVLAANDETGETTEELQVGTVAEYSVTSEDEDEETEPSQIESEMPDDTEGEATEADEVDAEGDEESGDTEISDDESDETGDIMEYSAEDEPMTIADESVEVATVADMQAALKNADVSTITLTADVEIAVSSSNRFEVSRDDVTVDLNDHTITASATTNYLFYVTGNDFTLKNGTIDGGESARCNVVYSTTKNLSLSLDGLTVQNFASTPVSFNSNNGSLSITNCTICGNVNNSGATNTACGGAINAGECDSVTISNCKINSNQTTNSGISKGHGGAAFLKDVSVVTISNCEVNNNSSKHTGGGICLWDCGEIQISENEISNNTGNDYGGGLVIYNEASSPVGNIAIENNTVSNNYVSFGGYTPSGDYGGGIAVCDLTTSRDDSVECVFSGNTITENSTDPNSFYGRGGGIHLRGMSTGITFRILSGTIKDNVAAYSGGGVDFSDNGSSTLYLYNTIIRGNEAGQQGGGLWTCPSSITTMNVTLGGTIYGNIVKNDNNNPNYGEPSGDDIFFEGEKDTEGLFVKVSSRALGGMLMDWYADDIGDRYESGDEPVDVTDPEGRYYNATETFGLHGELSEEGIALAEAEAKLLIEGNYALLYGGGVMSNGTVVFGESTEMTVTATKIWVDEEGNTIETGLPVNAVDVTLIRVDEEGNKVDLETVSLNEDNDWTHVFTDLPTNYTYETREETVVTGYAPGYRVEKDEDGNEIITIINSKLEELTIEKEVSGDSQDTTEFEFQVELTEDGTPYTGNIDAIYSDDRTESLAFENGKATVALQANETVTLSLASGMTWTVTELTEGADNTLVYVDGVLKSEGTQSSAKAASGTIADSTQVKFVNSYREYYDIDEEIVVDEEDPETWVKNESVNEYNAIEIEMSTYLPTISGDELQNGNFTMNFHDVLDSELNLDENDADFTVVIGGYKVDHKYYTISISDDTGDGCSFHVDVDLTALYNDGVITEDDLLGDTEIMIYFYADLEGTGLNGSYTSTVWYELFDGDELLYTSSKDVVTVYTYEIVINKYDETTLEGDDYDSATKLADAKFGVFEDEKCSQAVSRYGEDYTVTTDEDGTAIFYGLAEGTYYVKELEAPEGYDLSDEIVKVTLGTDMDGYEYDVWFANTPIGGEPGEPEPGEPEPSEPEPSEPENPGTTGGSGAPKTGDTNNLGGWLALMAACAVIVGDLCYIKRRRNKMK